MPSNASWTLLDEHLHRRGFLKVTGVSTATTALGVLPAGLVYAAALTQSQRKRRAPKVSTPRQ